VDLQLALRGDNLAQLYPLLGIALPATKPYAIDGHFVHSRNSGAMKNSPAASAPAISPAPCRSIAAGKRPALKGDLVSKRLDLADLGELIGAHGNTGSTTEAAPTRSGRVLPDMPFKTERWDSVDAEVSLRAGTLRHSKRLPLENLVTHLSLRDAVLTLDPLDFGLAGGQLKARIALDGRRIRSRRTPASRREKSASPSCFRPSS
jgi:uncharacterized protein involved in outer membrane biogenesis